jgi:hypothetical protein
MDAGSPRDDVDAAISDATSEASAALCPDLRGWYGFWSGYGSGCGSLYGSDPACVRQTGCDVTFQSVTAGSTPGAPLDGGPAFINGTATLQIAGNFVNGSLTIGGGGVHYSDCTGTWDASASVLAVACEADAGCAASFIRNGPPSSGCN